MKTVKFTIVVTGQTEEAFDDALAEALARIKKGNLAGQDSNGESAFTFDSTESVPESEIPV
jgi:hypothetical protein